MNKLNKIVLIVFVISITHLYTQVSNDILKTQNKNQTDREKADFLLNRGIGFYNLNNYTEALNYLNESLQIYKNIEDKKNIARCLNNIGNVYNNLGNYDKALDYHLQSLRIDEELDDKIGITSSLNNIGNVYQNINDHEKALEYYLKALQLTYEIDDKHAIATALNNVGNVHLSQGDFERALDFYNRSLKIKELIDDKFGIANSFNNIGIAYQGLQNSKKALEYYQKSLNLMEELGDSYGITSALYHSGILYLELQNLTKALSFLERALKKAKSINDEHLKMSCYKALSEIYYKKRNYKKAYIVLELYSEIKDNIFNEEREKAIAELLIKYETASKEKEIELLKKNAFLKELESKRKTLFLIFLVVGFVFFAISAFFIYNQFRLKAYSNTIIAEQNEKLKEAYYKVEQLASTDPLTGLSNRRDILNNIKHETNRFERNKKPFVLVMGDIDNFKYINDTYGHEAGDLVLKSIAELINTNIRKQDTVGRWGGEEFLILLPDTTLKGGANIAEKLRQTIQDHKMSHSNYELSISITFGVSMYNKIKDINECIKEADKALYVGKIRNKNCVVTS